MVASKILPFVLFSLSHSAVAHSTFGQAPIWPHPSNCTSGSEVVAVSSGKLAVQILTPAGKGKDIEDAVDRFFSRTFTHRTTAAEKGPAITSVAISVEDVVDVVQLETDESYEIVIPDSDGISKNHGIEINAKTSVGAYHALETLSQLIRFNFTSKLYYIAQAPWTIDDKPRFKHREVLVDTSRHFEPVAVLKGVLDSMSYAKINVLHWHLTDSQSFPFDSASFPRLSEFGAYSDQERYSSEDIEDVVEYARKRGIRAVVEIDTPGHAGSFCKGYPEICPSDTCQEPLNPATNRTFEVLEGIIFDLLGGEKGKGLFYDNMMHLGGDEVNTECWNKTDSVRKWIENNNMTTSSAYLYMVKRTQEIAQSMGRQVIGWEEIWNNFGTKLDKGTIIQQWRNTNATQEATAAGYRVIWSMSGHWYLDWLDGKWDAMYTTEPCEGISDKQCELVIGGGGEMWGESVDGSDIQQTVWPRLGAIAERLWSPRTLRDTDVALPRLHSFRCLLVQRGVAAAPVLNDAARSSPPHPGSCYAQ